MATYRYIVRDTTLYLRPIMIDGVLKTEVKEYGKKAFIVDQRPLILIEQSCIFYKTTYAARKEQTRLIADICHKPPIVLKPESGTYFFPTHSDRVPQSHWFNLARIDSYSRGRYNDTQIVFDDGSTVNFPISSHIINMQFLHAVKLEYCLRTKAIKNDNVANKEIDYGKSCTNIYEVLAMYALLEKQV